jgi:hypothetical protein
MDRGTMTHHLSEEQIAGYRGRRIPPAELPEIDDHLSLCADCRSRLASAGDLRAALQRTNYRPRPDSADFDSVLPEAAARGQHLAYEQLEAYLDRRSSRAKRELVRKHVEACRICADELRDLEAFKTGMAGSGGMRGWNLRAWCGALALATAAAIILVVSQKEMGLGPPLASSSQNTKPGESASGEQTLIAGSGSHMYESDMLSLEEQRAVNEAFSQQKISFPKVLAELQGKQQTLLGESQKGPRFEVLAPLAEVVLDVRPVFRWQPVTGARSYSVAIFDAKLNSVQSSASMQATEWTPDRPLKRGQLYEWQVTAKLGGGKSVSAPSPPSPEAKFRVVDQKNADELAHFQEANAESHIVLGILYAQAGLLEQGERELEQVPKSDPKLGLINDPKYGLAQNLLKSIRQIRHSRR